MTDRTAAERQRRRRLRRRCGIRLYSIELDPDVIATLIDRGLVAPGDADDPHALAFALGLALEDLLMRTVTP